jgi:hypothetical protein
MARPFSYQEAEVLAAQLVDLGYAARSYPVRPHGFKVMISGLNGGRRFSYAITDPDADVAAVLDNLQRGLTGEGELYEEGVR